MDNHLNAILIKRATLRAADQLIVTPARLHRRNDGGHRDGRETATLGTCRVHLTACPALFSLACNRHRSGEANRKKTPHFRGCANVRKHATPRSAACLRVSARGVRPIRSSRGPDPAARPGQSVVRRVAMGEKTAVPAMPGADLARASPRALSVRFQPRRRADAARLQGRHGGM